MFKVILVSIVTTLGLAACMPVGSVGGSSDADRARIEQLEKDLAHARGEVTAAEAKTLEEQKQRARQLDCHRDFRGSYGILAEKTVHLKRETARVIRKAKDDGRILSDAKETVTDPRNTVYLPEFKILNDGKVEVVVLNRQTCEGGGFYQGTTRFNEPYLWVDRANAWLTHELFPGLNEIDFGVCDKSGKTAGVSKDCGEPTWVATLNLTMTYEETQLADREVVTEPTAADPQPTATKP